MMQEGQLKISRYAREVSLADGRTALVSNWTGAIVAVNDEALFFWRSFAQPREKLSLPADVQPQVQALLKTRLLVPAEIDEYQAMRRDWEAGRQKVRAINAVFVLTYACNLRCTYCYEGAGIHLHGTMDQNVADAAVAMVLQQVKERNCQYLEVGFFGGEPLLTPDLILYIVTKFEEQAPAGVRVGFSATTNGTLLSDEIIDFFAAHRGVGVQVTLDGPKEIHDARRPYAGGKGSYNTILANIKKAQEKMFVSVRINLDRDNAAFAPALLAELAQQGFARWRAAIDLQPVEDITSSCAGYAGVCLSPPEFAGTVVPLYEKALQLDIPVVLPAVIHAPFYCQASFPGVFFIDPAGGLYKCAGVVGRPEFAVGNVLSTPPFDHKLEHWVKRQALDWAPCAECDMIGFCGGGCMVRSFEKTGNWHSSVCPFKKFHFEDMVRFYVRLKEQHPEKWRRGLPVKRLAV